MQQKTQKAVKKIISRMQQIPEDEQITTLDGVAMQRNLDIRERRNYMLQRNPPSVTLPGVI